MPTDTLSIYKPYPREQNIHHKYFSREVVFSLSCVVIAGSESGDFKPVRGETEHAVEKPCAPDPLESVEREATKFEKMGTSSLCSAYCADCFGLESAWLWVLAEYVGVSCPSTA